MKRFTDAVLVFVIWLLLTWSFTREDVIAGAVLSVIVALLVGDFLPTRPARLIAPLRWLLMLVYMPYFLWYCVKANLDVAYRVIHPEMPIRPGIVKVRTNLKTELGKTFLATSITLTPGTLVIDIVGQDLYVHWINVSGDNAEEHTREIVGPFEPLLRMIFE